MKQFSKSHEHYAQWLEDLHKRKYVTAFSSADVFSCEPYYAELNKLGVDDFEFYPNSDSIVQGELHAVYIQDGKIIFARYFCAEDIYYDSFFFYNDKVNHRFQIYTNGIETKTIFVEKLIINEDHTPRIFSRIDQYGFSEQIYQHERHHCNIKKSYFSKNGERHSKENIKVVYTENQVSTIHNLTRGITVFDRQQNEEDLPQLLQKCHDLLIKKIQIGVKKANICEQDICALLLEYNLQHAFPPSIGFAQKKEQKHCDNKGYVPLSWLNAPDMALFYECEFFFPDEKGLYDEINAKFAAFDYESQEKQIFDFYIRLCKRLKTCSELNALLNTTKDYFVTACDFEAGNHQDFLKALLPIKQFEQFQEQIQAYETSLKNDLDCDKDYQLVIETLDNALTNWSIYENKFRHLNCAIGYSTKLLFSIQPFYAQTELKKADFDVIQSLSLEPETESYYQYHHIDNKMISIIYYLAGEPIHQTYFDYNYDYIEVVKYFRANDKLKVKSFDRFSLHDSRIVSQFSCTTISCSNLQYYYNEERLITKINESNFLYSSRDNLKFDGDSLVKHICYRLEGSINNVESITSTSNGDTEHAFFLYSIDDSFVWKAMEHITILICDVVIDNLKEFKKLPNSICFEKDDQISFPPKIYYKLENKWTVQNDLYISMLSDQALEHTNFTLYVFHENYLEDCAYFSRQQCLNYIDQAFQMLCDRAYKAVTEYFSNSIEVIYKDSTQSFEEVEKITKGRACY